MEYKLDLFDCANKLTLASEDLKKEREIERLGLSCEEYKECVLFLHENGNQPEYSRFLHNYSKLLVRERNAAKVINILNQDQQSFYDYAQKFMRNFMEKMIVLVPDEIPEIHKEDLYWRCEKGLKDFERIALEHDNLLKLRHHCDLHHIEKVEETL